MTADSGAIRSTEQGEGRMKNLLNKTRSKAMMHKLPLIVSIFAVALLYWFGALQKPSFFTWGLQLPALVVLCVTALARVNDISKERTAWIWQWRRIGLTLVGVCSAAWMFAPFQETPDFPSWKTVMLAWGFALSWISTPGMPPWWKYVSGEARLPEEQR